MFKVVLFIVLFFNCPVKISAQGNCDTVYVLFNKQHFSQTIPVVSTFEKGKTVSIISEEAKIFFFDYKYLAENPGTKQKLTYHIRFENMNYHDSLPFIQRIKNTGEIKSIQCNINLDEIDNYDKAEALLKKISGKNKTVYLIDYNNPRREYIFIYKVFPMALEPIRGSNKF